MIRAGDPLGKLIISGLDDWVSLGEAAYLVSTTIDDGSSDEVRTATLSAVRRALELSLMQAGQLGPGFAPWESSPDDTVRIIEERWTDPDRQLLPGDVCWLANTSHGADVAEAVWRRDVRPLRER